MKKYFKDFGIAVRDVDLWTKLSLIIMGAGYLKRGQIEINTDEVTSDSFCFLWR